MNRQEQRGDFPKKSLDGTRGSEDWQVPSDIKEGDQPSGDQESFAYQLLLLQQRLVAYEQLHLEEIAELRQEIEQLRRAFLQETHPQLRAIAPLRDTHDSGSSV